MTIIDISGSIRYIKKNLVQIILIFLAIYDLRIDLRLLFDFFTFSTLFYTITEHPLAISVLLIIPTMFNSLKNNSQ